MPTLNLNIHVDGLEYDTLRVVEYSGCDSFSQSINSSGHAVNGFRFDFQLASRKPSLQPIDIIDRSVDFEIVQNGKVVQQLNGIVRQFSKGDTGHHHTFYKMIVVPALERLSLRRNSRIFQKKTTPEILSVLLQEMGISDYAFNLKHNYTQREFVVQYRESDLDFLHRLSAEEGMVYSFLHELGKHTLLFTDSNDGLGGLDSSIPYVNLSGGVVEEPFINTFSTQFRSEVSHTELQDYSFKKPTYSFAQKVLGTQTDYQRSEDYEHFDFPGRFKSDGLGSRVTEARLGFLRRDARVAIGKSNHGAISSGKKFRLQEHPDSNLNREWVVVSSEHFGTQPQALEEEGNTGETTYRNELKAIPSDMVWQAKPMPKPRIDGPMIATVVGPQGEDIYCDDNGRVKIHFDWDRYSNTDEFSSCWVRVSQAWAGSRFGIAAIPRVGHEVIVSFLNGDPDQPIVTGRTYHAINTPPYSLPKHKTKTVIRTESYKGQGFNELSFEDQVDQERIYIHAQKDMDVEVKNDHVTKVDRDIHLAVENDEFDLTKNNRHLTVLGEYREKVSSDKSINISGSLQQKVKSKTVFDVSDEVHFKGGNKIVLDAGSAITIKAGGSFVTVDAGGVHVVGSAINLNSGGSASNGSGFGGLVPALPMGLEALAAPVEVLPLNIEQQRNTLIEAAMKGRSICQVCEVADS
ncbi:type VI secretion system Vgr family protein [Vibrio sp. TBV020]|uniref:type VI secretion system Vgr family protein n=1 Tax=Vibrio sp. TBV020 TaxID=3137398 RepID=UPI0038CD9A87